MAQRWDGMARRSFPSGAGCCEVNRLHDPRKPLGKGKGLALGMRTVSFWVAQRFQRCDKGPALIAALAAEGKGITSAMPVSSKASLIPSAPPCTPVFDLALDLFKTT